ncbi:DUF6774 domain-containing protein [Hydrogenoanaerobacterium sp.]|uniref:DUF6774 domain-containing protein n=1 Tax=Hydrogenoanaerobacterium sp. TaxID=2953763 RepID=UPI0028979550|nr:DUF6774 domain-containing protein [Hydrogenoanaerobacterium sp.]
MFCPEDLAAAVSAISIAVSKGRTVEELNVLAAVFTQVGAVIATIAVQKNNIQDCIENAQKNSNQPDTTQDNNTNNQPATAQSSNASQATTKNTNKSDTDQSSSNEQTSAKNSNLSVADQGKNTWQIPTSSAEGKTSADSASLPLFLQKNFDKQWS